MLAVSQLHDLQVNSEDLHLWSRSPSAHKYQDELKALKSLLPISLFRLPFRRLRQAKERGGICSRQKLTLIRMATHIQATEHPFRDFHFIQSIRQLLLRQILLKFALRPEDTSSRKAPPLGHPRSLSVPKTSGTPQFGLQQQIISNTRRQLHSLIFSPLITCNALQHV